MERTELGTILGAFRDVAYSIGMQVMNVRFRVRRKGEVNARAPQGKGHGGLPQGRSRRELKLIALVQTFADTALYEGYVLEGIDLRQLEGELPAAGKDWEIGVEVRRE